MADISGSLSGSSTVSGLLGSSTVSGSLAMPFGAIDAEIEELRNELQNIRLGADGTTYDTAGISVRTQIQNIINNSPTVENGKLII